MTLKNSVEVSVWRSVRSSVLDSVYIYSHRAACNYAFDSVWSSIWGSVFMSVLNTTDHNVSRFVADAVRVNNTK